MKNSIPCLLAFTGVLWYNNMRDFIGHDAMKRKVACGVQGNFRRVCWVLEPGDTQYSTVSADGTYLGIRTVFRRMQI